MKKLGFLLLFALCQFITYGQSLNGTIKDDLGRKLENVEIFNLRNNTHAHSDVNGLFTLVDVMVGDTLRTSHIGYYPDTFVIRSMEVLNITLSTHFISLDEIIISPEINAMHAISKIDIETKPVNSSQDILRQVPGLIIGQHAGGGKAEQIFLRGFDVDHGTDVSVAVDGIPVNMVSHAHGQGYADLHFIIPETIDKINYGKGPYDSDKGNFATGGYVDFQTKNRLKQSIIKTEIGAFNTKRLMSMLQLSDKKIDSYIATEFISSDGPFDSPQNFHRVNLFGKIGIPISKSKKIEFSSSYFDSRWDASGQIPQRAVDNKSISRFGAIDDTEGGSTGRKNINLRYQEYINDRTKIKSNIYYSQYDFELFSNFTFFLEDSINGDQILQKENRELFGTNASFEQKFSGNFKGGWAAGISLRQDVVDNSLLSRTKNRTTTLEKLKHGDIQETNAAPYFNLDFIFGKWKLSPALRFDYFNHQFYDKLQTAYSLQSKETEILSPKLNVFYNASNKLQLFIKTGRGFHSNDTRVVVTKSVATILPAATGADIGLIWKPQSSVIVNLALWQLNLEQEFVYVGDAGIVEPSGESIRKGVDLGLRYQPKTWGYFSLDVNYSHARSGGEYIPLAPNFTGSSSFILQKIKNVDLGIHLRYVRDRPANEDNSIIAEGYTVVDFNSIYRIKNIRIGAQIQNLLNTEWNEAQFATESRLMNEVEPLEELHFTPGVPFFLKAIVAVEF
jgi:outer membrane cobalamin receptor